MEIIKSFLANVRTTITNLRALGVCAGLYALLLVTFYIFISTREATVWQVMITYAFAVLVPVEFFVLQSLIVNYVREGKMLWREVGRTAIKLFVATIPVIVMGLVFWALLDKFQLHYPAPKPALAETLRSAPKPQPLHWPSVIFATIRFLLFAIALPLATIHLWINVAGRDLRSLFIGGAEASVKRIGQWLTRAFASDSILIYAIGLVLFALIPYAIIFAPVSPKGTKTDFAVFIVRILLAFFSTLVGWIATAATLTKLKARASTAVATSPVSNAPAEAPA